MRFEEFIAEQVERYGPFVAVGQPGRRPEGAAREFYGDEHWQRAVITWMDQAQLLVAPPSWTAGLDWELRTAISRGHASKLVFVFPPGAANKQKRWAAVTAAFSDTPWGQCMAAAMTTDALVAHTWASGEIVVISSSRAEENELAAALHVAVSVFWCAPREGRGLPALRNDCIWPTADLCSDCFLSCAVWGLRAWNEGPVYTRPPLTHTWFWRLRAGPSPRDVRRLG